jgi:ArsR family metal-binding transcriptional regulator
MSKLLTTFPSQDAFRKTGEILKTLDLPHEIISPAPGLNMVGVSAVVLPQESRSAFMQHGGDRIINSGWVDYREASIKIPSGDPEVYNEDIFGRSLIMVLAPCIADPSKIRIIAYISGNLADVFPYMNAKMGGASYNPHGPIFTFMDGYKMVSLYPQRIAVAKADEIVDAWRVLEMIRVQANACWNNRSQIEPNYETRKKPPALEIYFRLPKTNCKQCGEKTCLAFALHLRSGKAVPSQCREIFAGKFGHLKDALLEICGGMGVEDIQH